MSEMGDDEKTAQANRKTSILLQAMGLFDVVFGAAFVVFGPQWMGGDPTTDMVLMIFGGFFFLAGIALWWLGRFRYGAPTPDENAATVVRTRR